MRKSDFLLRYMLITKREMKSNSAAKQNLLQYQEAVSNRVLYSLICILESSLTQRRTGLHAIKHTK